LAYPVQHVRIYCDFSYFLKGSECSDAVILHCGIFSNHFITNFPQNVPVKKTFENRSIFGDDVDQSLWLTFWNTSIHLTQNNSPL